MNVYVVARQSDGIIGIYGTLAAAEQKRKTLDRYAAKDENGRLYERAWVWKYKVRGT